MTPEPTEADVALRHEFDGGFMYVMEERIAGENWYGCHGLCIDRKFSDSLTLTNLGDKT